MEYTRIYITTDGQFGPLRMPWSEVCMHMRVADKLMLCQLEGPRMVQLFDPATGESFSAPILRGEAGIFTDAHGCPYYVAPPEDHHG